jgi:hypothetical protein
MIWTFKPNKLGGGLLLRDGRVVAYLPQSTSNNREWGEHIAFCMNFDEHRSEKDARQGKN